MKTLFAVMLVTLLTSNPLSAQVPCADGFVIAPEATQQFVMPAPAVSQFHVQSAPAFSYGYTGPRYYGTRSSTNYATALPQASTGFVSGATQYVAGPVLMNSQVVQNSNCATATATVQDQPAARRFTATGIEVQPLESDDAVVETDSAVRSIVVRKRTILVPASVAARLSTGAVVTQWSSSPQTLQLRSRSHRIRSNSATITNNKTANNTALSDCHAKVAELVQQSKAREERLKNMESKVAELLDALDSRSKPGPTIDPSPVEDAPGETQPR